MKGYEEMTVFCFLAAPLAYFYVIALPDLKLREQNEALIRAVREIEIRAVPNNLNSEEPADEYRINAKESRYNSAVEMMNKNSEESLKRSAEIFKSIEGWKDSAEQIRLCERKIIKINEAKEAALQEDKIINTKIIVLIAVACVLLIIILAGLLTIL
ncbi:MAG: hypothetical protein NC078_10275 [Ruminococcus sp.]|nr:hypothetical protein [Ruminococcus sp.]